jgi:hypothetical protein
MHPLVDPTFPQRRRLSFQQLARADRSAETCHTDIIITSISNMSCGSYESRILDKLITTAPAVPLLKRGNISVAHNLREMCQSTPDYIKGLHTKEIGWHPRGATVDQKAAQDLIPQ